MKRSEVVRKLQYLSSRQADLWTDMTHIKLREESLIRDVALLRERVRKLEECKVSLNIVNAVLSGKYDDIAVGDLIDKLLLEKEGFYA